MLTMKRSISGRLVLASCRLIYLLVGVLSFTCQAGADVLESASSSDNVLMLYNWPDYMPEALLKRFREETGIQVNIHYYTSDEGKQELLAQTGGEGLDLIIGSGATMREYIAPKWIRRLDATLIPGRKNIATKWRLFAPELGDHAVPLLWGTLGIAYRIDLVDSAPKTWADFFNPYQELYQRVMLVNDSADVFGMAQKSLGLPLNPQSMEQLDAAYKVLSDYRSFVYRYSYPRLDESSELLHDQVSMAMVYSGDALTLESLDSRIDYVHPKDGTNLWVDYIAVAERSRQPENAHRFIDFLLEPRNAALMAEKLNYGSTVAGVEAYLSADHLHSDIIYPPRSVMENAESFIRVKPELLRHRNQLFLELKR